MDNLQELADLLSVIIANHINELDLANLPDTNLKKLNK